MPASTDAPPRPRLFHFSDTHLGHQQYPRTDAAGLNVREQDIARAFRAVVDAAIAQRPDLVVHAGDLFDGVRPGNRALAAAMEGFVRLSQAGIPTVAIAGNHEHPKLRETGSPFRLFAHLPNVHMVFQGRRETIEVPTPAGPVRVHAVPQCADPETFAAEILGAPTGGPGHDVLAVHGAVSGLKAFSHAEFNELALDPAWFRPFHYVALGHHHGTTQVAPNAWYSGAPERVSIAESGQEKGFLDVRLGRSGQTTDSTDFTERVGSAQSVQSVVQGVNLEVTFRAVPGRTYVDLPPIEAEGMDAGQVRAVALETVARVPAGAVARLRIRGLDPALRGALDLRAVRHAGAACTHLDLVLEWSKEGLDVRAAAELRSVPQEFEAFAAQQPMEGAARAAILAKARSVLEAA
ncbi:MAG TPA: exonuclease SbcCD subunit D [Candidatus Thermoplasmatota archaeon]|nr:exonuclease SbcCD subunit D [Candidatus Thermoplasmatota archaeon]